MTADSSTATVTPSADDGANSLPSPSAQVVRVGIEPDSIAPIPSPEVVERISVFPDLVTVVESPPEGSDGGDNGNAGGVTRSPLSRPSANDGVDGTSSPVMGAASWLALSDSIRPGVKSLSGSSVSSSKPVSDESAGVSQKQVKDTAKSHYNPNHVRKRSGIQQTSSPASQTEHDAGSSRKKRSPGKKDVSAPPEVCQPVRWSVNIAESIARYTDVCRSLNDKYYLRNMEKALKFFQEQGDTEDAEALKEKLKKRYCEMFDLS